MSLIEKIEGLLSEVKDFKAKAPEEVESFRIRILGSKGELKKLFGEFKNVPSEARKEFGEKLNELKTKAQDKINELKSSSDSAGQSDDFIDLTRPSQSAALGSRGHLFHWARCPFAHPHLVCTSSSDGVPRTSH